MDMYVQQNYLYKNSTVAFKVLLRGIVVSMCSRNLLGGLYVCICMDI